MNLSFEPEMIFVQGGTFQMGGERFDEKPIHSVLLSDYYIGKYPVTQQQWNKIMGNNPSEFSGCDNCPVDNVNWFKAQEFIEKLNIKTGKSYRLPTEAEWEFAARGGNNSKGYRFSGSNNIEEVAWYELNSNKKTHPVGGLKPNELGIFDMSGNMDEWCSDWSGEYEGSTQNNPKGALTGNLRVVRGGSYRHPPSMCRASKRGADTPDEKRYGYGFRIAYSK